MKYSFFLITFLLLFCSVFAINLNVNVYEGQNKTNEFLITTIDDSGNFIDTNLTVNVYENKIFIQNDPEHSILQNRLLETITQDKMTKISIGKYSAKTTNYYSNFYVETIAILGETVKKDIQNVSYPSDFEANILKNKRNSYTLTVTNVVNGNDFNVLYSTEANIEFQVSFSVPTGLNSAQKVLLIPEGQEYKFVFVQVCNNRGICKNLSFEESTGLEGANSIINNLTKPITTIYLQGKEIGIPLGAIFVGILIVIYFFRK
jgi:hypothetical protein